jgi:hypothetical protein
MPQAQQPTQVRRDALPIAGRSMELDLRSFQRAAPAEGEQAPLATCEIVLSAGARVKRYDWYRERYFLEELVIDKGAIRMERLQRGISLLDTHSAWRLADVMGIIENPRVENRQLLATASFSRRADVAPYVQDVEDGIIRFVSAGYVRHRIEMVPPTEEGGLWIYRVTDWEPMEGSFVSVPADMDSHVVRTATGQLQLPDGRELQAFPCEFIEIRAAGATQSPAVGASAETPLNHGDRSMTPEEQAAADAKRAADEKAQRDAAAAEATRAEQARGAEITELCARHGCANLAAGLIRDGKSVDEARKAILDDVAHRDAAAGGHRNVTGSVQTVRDEHETRMAGIQDAILHRVMPGHKISDNGRQYRGMALLEMGREMLERSGVSTRGMARMELAQRILHHRSGMHTTSDFANLLANVANKRLRMAYDENPGTYGVWARRAPNAPDFKNMNVVQLSGAPALLQTNEHGEFKYGALSDGKETYSLITYGRIVAITRQAMVNDDLRAFDRLLGAFGNSARRLENATVYSQLTANGAMSDGTALFHADHSNLSTGAGSALAAAGLGAARTAMRKQTGLQGELLNVTPAYLLVPAALEQTAYQYTSTQYVPATKAEINEFRTGGRTALEPVVEPLLDSVSATAWYLAASSGQIDTVEYCYLDGEEGPVIETDPGFEVDGVSYKCRLDFAAKVIDHRGLHKANGA